MGCSTFAEYAVIAEISAAKIHPGADLYQMCLLGKLKSYYFVISSILSEQDWKFFSVQDREMFIFQNYLI